ncbi:MAG: HepT-like ribonuclease domain-containing protein [Clostridia bacterium]
MNDRQIPWKELAGIRDITAHRYQTLRMEDVFIM